MKRVHLFLILIAGTATGALVGFFFGLHIGVGQFELVRSYPDAYLLTVELRQLRDGKASQLITLKEIELDGKIVQGGQFVDSGHPWLFWPSNSSLEQIEKLMPKVAQYRKAYPSEDLTIYLKQLKHVPDDDPIKQGILAYRKEVDLRTRQLIQKYGN